MHILEADDPYVDDLSEEQRVVWVKQLLGRAVAGPRRQHLGHVHDVVTQPLPDSVGTVVVGLIADVGGQHVFAPSAAVRGWTTSADALEVSRHRHGYRRHPSAMLLAADVLGQPVTVPAARKVSRISDIALRRSADGWAVWAIDTRGAIQRVLGSSRRLVEWHVLAQRRVAAVPPPGQIRRSARAAPTETIADSDQPAA